MGSSASKAACALMSPTTQGAHYLSLKRNDSSIASFHFVFRCYYIKFVRNYNNYLQMRVDNRVLHSCEVKCIYYDITDLIRFLIRTYKQIGSALDIGILTVKIKSK